jgi:Protein of unknown function (DUF669)
MAKGKGMRIDFTGVPEEIRQRSRRIPEGDYIAKIMKHEKRTSKNGNAYFSWTMQVVSDAKGGKKYAGVPLFLNTSLKPEALFALRNLIFAVSGKNVAGRIISFEGAQFYGKQVGVVVEDNEYESTDGQSRINSSVAAVVPMADLLAENVAEDEDEDEEDEEEEEEEEDEDLEDVELE